MDLLAVKATIEMLKNEGFIEPKIGGEGEFVYTLLEDSYFYKKFPFGDIEVTGYIFGMAAVEPNGNYYLLTVLAIPHDKSYNMYDMNDVPLGDGNDQYAKDSVIAHFLNKFVIENAKPMPDGNEQEV